MELFFEECTTVVEQMALNTDVQTLLEETGPGANITESERYATVFNSMKKTVAADSDNIQAVWVGDIDANVATQSDGYTSGSDFEITERAWYKDVYKRQEDNEADFRMMMSSSAGSPIRSMMISGGIKGGVLPGMVEMANGHFFRGIGMMLGIVK